MSTQPARSASHSPSTPKKNATGIAARPTTVEATRGTLRPA